MARTLEDNDMENREKQENLSPSKHDVVPPSPPPTHTKDKQNTNKGKGSLFANMLSIICHFQNLVNYELPKGEPVIESDHATAY